MKYLFLVMAAIANAAESGSDAAWIEAAGGTVQRNAAGQIAGVNLRASWVTDSDLRKLNQIPALESIDLSLTRVTDQGMQELKGLPNVTNLNLRFAEYVTDEGVAAIKNWKKLKHVVLHGTKASDTSLEHISGIAALETVDIGSGVITDVGLERLTTLPNLKALSIGGNELGDAGLQALRQMPSLTYLDLMGRQGTDSNVWTITMSEVGLEAVLTLSQLQHLRMGCTTLGVGVEGARFATVSTISVTPRWIEKMKVLKKLRRLSLQGCDKVDDAAASILSAFPALEEVDLKGTAVTAKGLAALKAAKPKLRVQEGPWEGRSANFRNN